MNVILLWQLTPGLLLITVGAVSALGGINSGWLILATGEFVNGYLFRLADNIPGAIMNSIFAAMALLCWWYNGGGDDFRKRRKKLGAKLTAQFRKFKVWQPPALAPAGGSA